MAAPRTRAASEAYSRSERRLAFASHFHNTGDPGESYVLAGYSSPRPGYATAQGVKLLAHPEVVAALAVLRKESPQQAALDLVPRNHPDEEAPTELLRHAGDVQRATEAHQRHKLIYALLGPAFTSMTDIADWDEGGRTFHLRSSAALSPLQAAAIRKLRVTRTRRAGRRQPQRGAPDEAIPGDPPADDEGWEVERVEVDLYDRVPAIRLLGLELGMFAERRADANDEEATVRRIASLFGENPDEVWEAVERARNGGQK